jgi:hypothetical protein
MSSIWIATTGARGVSLVDSIQTPQRRLSFQVLIIPANDDSAVAVEPLIGHVRNLDGEYLEKRFA